MAASDKKDETVKDEPNNMFHDIDTASTEHLAKAAKAKKDGKKVTPTKVTLADGTVVIRH